MPVCRCQAWLWGMSSRRSPCLRIKGSSGDFAFVVCALDWRRSFLLTGSRRGTFLSFTLHGLLGDFAFSVALELVLSLELSSSRGWGHVIPCPLRYMQTKYIETLQIGDFGREVWNKVNRHAHELGLALARKRRTYATQVH